MKKKEVLKELEAIINIFQGQADATEEYRHPSKEDSAEEKMIKDVFNTSVSHMYFAIERFKNPPKAGSDAQTTKDLITYLREGHDKIASEFKKELNAAGKPSGFLTRVWKNTNKKNANIRHLEFKVRQYKNNADRLRKIEPFV